MSGAIGVLGGCGGVEIVRVDPSELAGTARLVWYLPPFESGDFVECECGVGDRLAVYCRSQAIEPGGR
jgi:hypothetical protein